MGVCVLFQMGKCHIEPELMHCMIENGNNSQWIEWTMRV